MRYLCMAFVKYVIVIGTMHRRVYENRNARSYTRLYVATYTTEIRWSIFLSYILSTLCYFSSSFLLLFLSLVPLITLDSSRGGSGFLSKGRILNYRVNCVEISIFARLAIAEMAPFLIFFLSVWRWSQREFGSRDFFFSPRRRTIRGRIYRARSSPETRLARFRRAHTLISKRPLVGPI